MGIVSKIKSVSFLRIFKWLFLVFLIIFIPTFIYFYIGETKPAESIDYGITFSKLFAEDLHVDWKEAYLSILDELQVDNVRLVAYWEEIEPEKGVYDFNALDWQIREADRRNVDIILALGHRVPRWPECHAPEWSKGLSRKEWESRLLTLIQKIVDRYESEPAIFAWQVENEPFLKNFGVCPELDEEFLMKEINLVKNSDYNLRPIILTASGELSSWIKPAKLADILGVSLYRVVWVDWFGYVRYPLMPLFYQRRSEIVRKFTDVERVILIELQAEPWGPKQIYETTVNKQLRVMNLEYFKENVEYARQAGFDEVYFWGAEWWYWMKENYSEKIWQEAMKLWRE